VAKDEVQAVAWFRKAADQGDTSAQSNLGNSYYNGTGVPEDLVEAVKWYRKAADQGHAEAQFNLGVCYYKGAGTQMDLVEAYAYWSLAGRTDADARRTLANLEKKLSHEASLLGQQRAKELHKEIEAKMAAKKAGK
jgi:TPR repeat protein